MRAATMSIARLHSSPSAAGLARVRALAGLALLVPFLAACASTGPASTPRPGKGATIREPVRATPRDPTFQTIPGLQGVIGASESQLVRQFGAARLNVWEGDARKLQFTGKACVLDVFLYPTAQSKEPLASYVDARRSSDGQDVDRAACVAALKGR
ncbi:hypothetical protein [Novosphingobium sp. 9U]|uniref:hypothetical protein n=1 Tax=Novosphingobium sp. 9U TaxID=2653158 RepID=UPI0012F378EF|nr:hypothetical protein [Novosphingobium sp. 9U]VWX53656.1 conserved hypothetical protein [Novosphingobium sp. 9U]